MGDSISIGTVSVVSRLQIYKDAPYLGVNVKWSSAWEYIYTSLAYSFTLEAFIHNIKVGEWDEEGNFIQQFIVYAFIGIPLYYTYMVLGQYSQMGTLDIKHLLPIGHGLAYTIIICTALQTFKYGIWLANMLLYCLVSLQAQLPWMHCPNVTTDTNLNFLACYDGVNYGADCQLDCISMQTFTSSLSYHMGTFLGYKKQDEKEHFWPPINRTVALCTAWVLIFIFVQKLYIRSRKVLLVLMVVALALLVLLCTGTISATGGKTGIGYLFEDIWLAFKRKKTWSRSISSACRELSLGEGIAMIAGAKLRHKHNISVAPIFFCIILGVISTSCTLFLQSIIGMICYKSHTTLEKADCLIPPFEFLIFFIPIPQGLGYLTVPQVWSLGYFSFSITILLANQIARITCIYYTISNTYSSIVKYAKYLLAGYCMITLAASLAMEGDRNYYHCCNITTVTTTLVQLINIAYMSIIVYWIYGVKKLSDDIHFLCGTPPTRYWKICWYVIPIILVFTVYEEYSFYIYDRNLDKHSRQVIDITTLFTILPIPICWIVEAFKHVKKRDLTGLFRSTDSWGPADPEERHRRLSFNPRKQTRYLSKSTVCNHHCIVGYRGLLTLHKEETIARERRIDEKSSVYSM